MPRTDMSKGSHSLSFYHSVQFKKGLSRPKEADVGVDEEKTIIPTPAHHPLRLHVFTRLHNISTVLDFMAEICFFP